MAQSLGQSEVGRQIRGCTAVHCSVAKYRDFWDDTIMTVVVVVCMYPVCAYVVQPGAATYHLITSGTAANCLHLQLQQRQVYGSQFFTAVNNCLFNIFTAPPVGGRGIVFARFVSFFLCFFVSNITRKRLDRFAWNFQGRCGVTMGPPDYILGQFG